MAKIIEITIHAGRVVPHPFLSYSNLKPGLSFKAALEDGEDPIEATKALQAQAESLLEDHSRHMMQSLQELHDLGVKQEQIHSLQRTIQNAQRDLDRARESLPAIENGSFGSRVTIDTWDPKGDDYEYDPEDKA